MEAVRAPVLECCVPLRRYTAIRYDESVPPPAAEGRRTSARLAAVVRFGSRYLVDAAAWIVGLSLAIWFRYAFDVPTDAYFPVTMLILVTLFGQLLFGFVFELYRGRFSFGSLEEVRALGVAVAFVAVCLGVPVLLLGSGYGVPRSIFLIATPLALVAMFSVRFVKRLLIEQRNAPKEGVTRTLVYGAGVLGSSLVRQMLSDPTTLYRPVGLIDDDPAKRQSQVRDVRVLGAFNDLPRIVERTRAQFLVVAVPRADSTLLRLVQDMAMQLDLTVKVVPTLSDILAGRSGTGTIRDISIEDLIGRHPVDTDLSTIAGYLTGRRVLVTGAGGSIGLELCKQIAGFGPSELVMLDRDETGLQQAQLATAGHGLLNTKDVVLCDIRDAPALDEVLIARRPEVVFHAAALKHLPMLEQYPDEAWKTNVLGTLNVINAARLAEVDTFINVSTDKAANPTSVLGHSKRVAEKLTAWAADDSGFRYLSVRFGNVIGSRGSMLPTFQSLIEAGGPLTVTHPDVTRYFMTIPEACQLVIQAGAIGRPGEILILDMGEPVRILDVAKRMIAMSGKQIEIAFTGLREGEKLHEELVGVREKLERPFHPMISHTRADTIPPTRLDHDGWMARMFAEPRVNDTAVLEAHRAQKEHKA
ncbi:polysaccharide biosynthesis protein [Microbacterium sp. LRZ72]|uniref:polysaccharide biosynthesis protein n=1 Tax=Microbacterium sp. LRZ72 TaxID=2942481 RepID=UPI0029AEE37F|nr:nucleoside-diphosphate sugar epimerase/dehydratase [Microbacterium sp. LRZ72]MDX2377628.1 polysaccharide biosynthesis protein [Microbacterium sp. LRZ72]